MHNHKYSLVQSITNDKFVYINKSSYINTFIDIRTYRMFWTVFN